MNPSDVSRRLAKVVYRVTRIFVWLISTAAVLAIAAFVFLRVYGVPGPILREIMRHVNAAGIPAEVDGILLTLHGWRADHVRYYSANPDDLEPLFLAERVFFSIRNSRLRETERSGALNLDVRAVGVGVNPSVEWGLSIPKSSPSRQIDQINLSLRFVPDHIQVSHGEIEWLGARFNVNGTLLGGEERATKPIRKQKTLFPAPVSEERFQAFEDYLQTLNLPHGVTVDIDFSIDTIEYAASRVELAVHAEAVELQQVEFSKLEIAGSYAYPTLQIEHARLFQDRQSLQISGEYNIQSGIANGALYNSITSPRPLCLLPDWMREVLDQAELRFDQLPRLEVEFGPSTVKEFLNHLSGTFSIHDVAYKEIDIEALRGQIKRENRRLELINLQGTLSGQAARAEAYGSGMHGGTAAGTAFWDENTREFGVEADVNFDPNLLVRALSPVKIATNIIQRFKFKGLPPKGHIALGANVDDWSTFYIDIQAMANDVVFQGVEFNSINAVETYRNGKLNLDPVAAMKDAEFIKGYARIDFRADTVSFDALTSMQPADLEDLIYPSLNLFGNHITTEGDVRITAQGIFDWGSMKATDFSAKVEVEQLEIPIATMDRFSAEVSGEGPLISLNNAVFGLYEGEGKGDFSMEWNPPQKSLPYEVDLSFSGVDFYQCLVFLRKDPSINISGTMEGTAQINADFSTHFFSSANGKGFVRVENGQLADLPLFQGFSRLMRKVFPTFTVFSITSLRGHFAIVDGVIASEDAYFEGDLLSAKARGRYFSGSGFDAKVQAQVLSEGRIFKKMVHAITNPLMKLLEMKLEGPLSNPSWNLEKF